MRILLLFLLLTVDVKADVYLLEITQKTGIWGTGNELVIKSFQVFDYGTQTEESCRETSTLINNSNRGRITSYCTLIRKTNGFK